MYSAITLKSHVPIMTLSPKAFLKPSNSGRFERMPIDRITVSALIGVCVSIGGTIGFVGLVTPHIVRMITGPNHRRLLPAVMFGGAVFLMLADLTARVILRPVELPIGVVTSFIGAVLFVYIFYKTRTSRGGR